MKVMICAIFILIFSFQISAPARSFTTYLVGWEIEGRSYDDRSKRWVKGRFFISVGVDTDNSDHLFFHAATSSGEAVVVRQRYDKDVQNKLEQVLSNVLKFLELGRVSSEGLGCFGDGDTGACKEQSIAIDRNQIAMRVGSLNDLGQAALIFELVDRKDSSLKAAIYFEENKFKQVSHLINEIPDSIKRMHRNAQQNSFLR